VQACREVDFLPFAMFQQFLGQIQFGLQFCHARLKLIQLGLSFLLRCRYFSGDCTGRMLPA
jgi:hypothetical protein